MRSQRAAQINERLRTSRLGREVIGPKVARPLASWLRETFAEDPVADGGQATVVEPVDETMPVAPIIQPSPEVVERASRIAKVKHVMLSLKDHIKDHNLVVVAAGIAFWGLLAIPAVLFAVVSIAGLLLDPATIKEQVNTNLDGLPEEVREIIGDQLENVSASSTGGLITGVVLGIVVALWTASGAMAKMMSTLNMIYGTAERRKFWVLRGSALLLTLGSIVFILGAGFLLAVLPALLSEIDGVGDSAATLFNWMRFPALGAAMIFALGMLYYVGPNREGRYRIFSWGALTATVLWVGLSALFSIYTATVGSYNETYGSLGGVAILLLWLFITAFVVLIGAEVHALTGRDMQDGEISPDD